MHVLWLMFRLWLHRLFLPDWAQNHTPDANHPYRRLFTRRHKVKRNLVKNIWIGAGLVMLINPVLHILLAIVLSVTFLSFAILDEAS